ncbi:Proline-serine-threonine phosphatase-interacting protein 2 [Mortierella claussenii]|nr:Proline-serine-threonine phosphatase-interacting protein 2 [Mortierella claussenii]
MNTERPPLQDDGYAPRFAQNFWGKDDAGYSALTARMRHAKLTCQEILDMFQARAALEEEYGKKLLKLSKSPLGKDELGSLRDSLDVVKYEIEATGKSHIELAGKMRDQLETALAEFNNAQKDKRKTHQASIDRTFRNKQLYLQQLVKAKEKYDAECIRTKGLSAAKMNLVGKELDKVSLKIEKTELASRAADIEYQASIRQLTEINDKWIVEWRGACDKFQFMEEQRIDYLRTTLWNYANIISSACVADDESCERIRSSLELCDVNQNLQSFIEQCGTGEDILDLPTYLSSKTGEGPDGASAVASQGTTVQEPRVRTVCGPHEPISTNSHSAPSSRRQSTYSVDYRSEGESSVPSGPVEMALTIGGNLFKLDPQTAALLNQEDDLNSPAHAGFPTRRSSNDRSASASVKDPQPAAIDNNLGISLDASGTVKEDRFPYWQPQAPLHQQRPASASFVAPSHVAHAVQYSDPSDPSANRIMPHGTVIQGRSQTMPLQGDPAQTSRQSMEHITQRRTSTGSYGGPRGVSEVHPAYQGQPAMTAAHPRPAAAQMTVDGRPILFYVRAMYDYDATIPEELSLKGGDILGVLHTRDDGWWEGHLMDEVRGPIRGLFPSNFTEPTA